MKQHELSTKIKSARYKSAVKGDKGLQSPHTRTRCETGENVKLYTFLDYLTAEGLEMEIKPIYPKPIHDLKMEYVARIYSNTKLREIIAERCGFASDATVLNSLDDWQFRVRFNVLHSVAEYYGLKLHDVCIGV
jgi:hypothetical protein